MCHEGILQNIIAQYQENIHKSHITFLNLVINSLCRGNFLTCVALSRGLKARTWPKHKIKRVDYMLSSTCLYDERRYFYSAIANSLMAKHSRPIILIGWPSITPCRKFHILRASIVVKKGGRALTIYEEKHPESNLSFANVHRAFILQLKNILPEDCHPIIVTDAGYKVPWFKLIAQQGWDYIGRVRGVMHCERTDENSGFISCKALYPEAKTKPIKLGYSKLSKTHKWLCHGYLVKQKLKGRKKKRIMGGIDRSSAGRKNAKVNLR